MTRFWLAPLFLIACTSSTPSGDDDNPTPDGPQPTLDPQDCTAFAQSLADAAAACGASLPSGGQAAVESWCKAGIERAALCGGNPSAGLDCFATPDPTDWTCAAGEPLPSCGGDIEAALGAYCVMALGNPACGSIACEFDVDCSGNSSCNSVTGKCFGDTAYCVGMPCAFDVDCPNSEKCNSAEGACVQR